MGTCIHLKPAVVRIPVLALLLSALIPVASPAAAQVRAGAQSAPAPTFDPQQAEAAGHFGLSGLRERAALVGGGLNVTSQPGTGTVVELKIKDFQR